MELSIMRNLYDASLKGCVSTLKTLIQKDPLILSRVIKELISAMPETEMDKVMTEVDDHASSILHLCVCYNHLEALKILVESMRGDVDQFLSCKDKEGNTVLDLAVQRGQIKIIKFLLSLSEMSETINTSKSETLRALDMLEHYPRDFISHTTQHILIQERAQTSSNIVIAVQDHIISPSNDPQQPQSLPINDPLQQAQPPISHPLQLPNPSPQNDPSQPSSHNPSPSNNPQHPQSPSPHNNPSQPSSHNDPLQPPPPFSPSNNPSQPSPTPSIANPPLHKLTRWDRFEKFCNTYIINQGDWITKEHLMVAATVIATMTFQSVISPPGGVWQEDTTTGAVSCPDYGFCEAGTAVVGYVWSPDYLNFIFFNSASFFTSLCVLLVVISGLPLHNQSFCQILLDIDPNLAAEVKSEGRCPLHLASAKGYTEIMRAILLTNPKTCFIRDKDDKLPVHFAAMRGRVEAIKELISAMPETETKCVRYNHSLMIKVPFYT
ncbi:hypothetical protein TSUD_336640 [Trifolium subterraneum]|uniref:PGG domain-containing protein n=1 Tax=Trifolium subterraneum TaxID=3900 RepID=A0A2Z6LVR1_TRISU|nr:hypothetical protein TSUD_336640 [Trifolium subterraneum]